MSSQQPTAQSEDAVGASFHDLSQNMKSQETDQGDFRNQQQRLPIEEPNANAGITGSEKEPRPGSNSAENHTSQQDDPGHSVGHFTHDTSKISPQKLTSGVKQSKELQPGVQDASSDAKRQKVPTQSQDMEKQPLASSQKITVRTKYIIQENHQSTSRADQRSKAVHHTLKDRLWQLEGELIEERARVRQLEAELIEQRVQIEQLEDDIREQEDIITNAHTNAISQLSRDVSSIMPDDRVRRELQAFFDQDALGWCMEYRRIEKIHEPDAAQMLASTGVLADSATVPTYLQMSMEGEATSAILLQAALARTLCDLFLSEPFFLQDWLPSMNIEPLKPENRIDLVTNWRVGTCRFLEDVFPPSTPFFKKKAELFARQYDYLMRELDEVCLPELTELMEQFGGLALQLWKRHVLIQVEGLEQADLKEFHSAKSDMDLHAGVRSKAAGQRLEGRPVQVMVRPRIVSVPVCKGVEYSNETQAHGLDIPDVIENEPRHDIALIAVMGVTGSGKSNFLRQILGNSQATGPIVGHDLDSCTQKTERYECCLGSKQVVFFDTPGFDDTYRGDADILADVAQVLSSSYKGNLKLNGVIYLHRIKDERMTNAIMRNLTMFRNLCGEDTKGEARERQLLERPDWWGMMKAKGSKARRFLNTRESALDIVSDLIDLDVVTLQVQEEMVHQGLEVDQTTAGEALNSEILEQRATFRKELQSLRKEKEQARRDHDTQLQAFFEKAESDKAKLLIEIENEHAALHADRREEARRMEQEFRDERLRLERKVREAIADSIRINEETEADARADKQRFQNEMHDQFYEFSQEHRMKTAKKIEELEQRLVSEEREGRRRLEEAMKHSESVVQDLKESMKRARREDWKKYEDDIRRIEKQQRDVANKCQRYMRELEKINREILDHQLAQQKTSGKERRQLEAKIRQLEEQKKQKTSTFWTILGSLAGVGSLLLAAFA
ncbi:hypothetical protein AK830_g4381 [Neonectria ditissima]|uniref:G domain-containing protein n=1 Tax=Neonectria ditissima TaxID=78410 RepID=A0A0N8H7L8_9HYPO|nr:hypothetical protein AK830_g4381 [Neonectria ditissima]